MFIFPNIGMVKVLALSSCWRRRRRRLSDRIRRDGSAAHRQPSDRLPASRRNRRRENVFGIAGAAPVGLLGVSMSLWRPRAVSPSDVMAIIRRRECGEAMSAGA